jgi:hypothetical protein
MNEVTEAMRIAGEEAFDDYCVKALDDDRVMVEAIYTAMLNAAPVGDELVRMVARAMQNAALNDGEGNTYRLFDLLDFSGENQSVIITRQLAQAAIEAMQGAQSVEAGTERVADHAFGCATRTSFEEGCDCGFFTRS